MLTPPTINRIIQEISRKHNQPGYGLSPPNKKILRFISFGMEKINRSDQSDITKINKMINLIEGFYRFLYHHSKQVLLLDIERLLTFIYYPENEETTLENKDNLLIGENGKTVRFWHDAYFDNNREAIYNRFFDCKNVMLPSKNYYEHFSHHSLGMPQQMHEKYEEMLSPAPKSKSNHSRRRS